MIEKQSTATDPVFGEIIPGKVYTKRYGSYGIIFNKEEEVCLIRIKSGYTLPGGGAENHETGEETLCREVKEETGFSVFIKGHLGNAVLYVFSEGEGYFEKICSYYTCEFKEVISAPAEQDHVPAWCLQREALEKLKDKDHPHTWALRKQLETAHGME